MTPIGLGVIAFIGIVMVLVGWFTAPRSAERGVAKLAARTGLEIDRPIADLVRRRLRRRVRACTGGAGVGLLVSLLARIASSTSTDPFSWSTAAVIVGAGVGALTVHVLDSGRTAGEPGVRAAVVRRRRLSDFLLPVEVAAPYAALLLPVSAAVAALASARTPIEPIRTGLLIAGVCVALAITAIATLAQRFVLGMSPPADSPTRLRWEDALRGLALRDIGITAYCVSYVLGAVTFGATGLLRAAGPVTSVAAAGGVFVVATAGLILLAVAAEGLTGPARRFLRLYETADGGQR
ncbi:MAG: hypothetical protein ACRDMV_20900 [Streptosporangiales bacterium]